MKMLLRKAQRTELSRIMEIIHQAQRSLAELGVDQWQDGYPDEAAILQDMENGYCHVVVDLPDETKKEAKASSVSSETDGLAVDGSETDGSIADGWAADGSAADGGTANGSAAGSSDPDITGRILGVAALIPDGEPDYAVIYDGAWLGQGEYRYLVVHRVAVDEHVKRRGVASFILSEAARIAKAQGFAALRLDTHCDNRRMQACLEQNGLRRCGIIHLGRGNLSQKAFEKETMIRLAYEKLL